MLVGLADHKSKYIETNQSVADSVPENETVVPKGKFRLVLCQGKRDSLA